MPNQNVCWTSAELQCDALAGGEFDFEVENCAEVFEIRHWRPPEFATAIIVADALVWEGADETLIVSASDTEDYGRYLVRALI